MQAPRTRQRVPGACFVFGGKQVAQRPALPYAATGQDFTTGGHSQAADRSTR